MAKILVADDEAAFLTLVKTYLEGKGHEIAAFRSSEAALGHLIDPKNVPPDLMVVDLMMPGIDGYDFVKRVQADGRLKSVPMILVTAKGRKQAELAETFNVAAFLQKPFALEQLTSKIAELTGAKR